MSYSSIPGPVAFVNASVLAGKSFDQLMFLGFFPRRDGEKKKLLAKVEKLLQDFPGCLISFYESPMRIYDTASCILSDYPNFDITMVREMNKVYEEVLPINLDTVEALRKIRGEITVLLKTHSKHS